MVHSTPDTPMDSGDESTWSFPSFPLIGEMLPHRRGQQSDHIPEPFGQVAHVFHKIR